MNTGMRYRNASPGKKVFIILLQLVMLTYVLLIIYPLFNMVMSSFKSTRDIMLSPFSLPESFSFENYVTIWVDKGFGRYFLNSLLFTGGAMVFVVLFGSMAAYGIARYKFRGNTLLYMLFFERYHAAAEGGRHPAVSDCEKPGPDGQPAFGDSGVHRHGPALHRVHPLRLHADHSGGTGAGRTHRRLQRSAYLQPDRHAHHGALHRAGDHL